MIDKELAEKVAGYLDYKLVSDCWWEKLEERPNSNKIPDYELEKFIFSWPVSGMMIEKMEKEGWDISIDLGFMCFLKKLPNGEMGYSKKTKEHCVDNNWHKAIAMAFCEAMEMIRVA